MPPVAAITIDNRLCRCVLRGCRLGLGFRRARLRFDQVLLLGDEGALLFVQLLRGEAGVLFAEKPVLLGHEFIARIFETNAFFQFVGTAFRDFSLDARFTCRLLGGFKGKRILLFQRRSRSGRGRFYSDGFRRLFRFGGLVRL